jgi:multiple sugar transport system substrate-binding protein
MSFRRTGMNRLLPIVVLLLSSLILSACSVPDQTSTASTDPNVTTITVWSFEPPGAPWIDAYIREFEEQHPDIKIEYSPFPEDEYQTKVATALAAHNPPDVAVIENKGWAKGGLVVDLTDHLALWGVNPVDFNQGGLGRGTLEGDISTGIFGVGDFLGANVLFYNKGMIDAAGLEYPPVDRSLTWPEYAELCRALAKPADNPTETIYGCAVPIYGFGIWTRWLYGEDGHTAIGNINSPEMVEAWNLGTALVRDGIAPNAAALDAFGGVADLFAQGKLALTQSDFTAASFFEENGINFGIAPFWVLSGSESFVDTWTAPWGTFVESPHPEEALEFIRFLATDAQRIRTETSSDAPLSMAVAAEINWGAGDPIKEQFLEVLKLAKPQGPPPHPFFVMPEGAYDAGEIFRLMTVEGQTDAKPLLDAEAEKTQPLLEEGWRLWEELGQAAAE